MSRDELLQAVLDTPHDDAPRLVLADWYMQQGDARGEFIVAQCQLMRRGLSPAARKQRRQQVAALLEAHESTWAAPVSAVASGWRFRRGFIDRIAGAAEQVLDGWRAAWAAEPIVELEITGAGAATMVELASSPVLERIESLTVRGAIGDDGAAALAGSPHLGRLARINVSNNDIGDDGVLALAAADGLRGCKRLALTGNRVGDEGAAALAGSPHLAGLEALFLSRTVITSDGVKALAGSPHLGTLSALSLGMLEELGDSGARALLESTALRSLRRLELDACYEISGKVLAALRQRWPALRT